MKSQHTGYAWHIAIKTKFVTSSACIYGSADVGVFPLITLENMPPPPHPQSWHSRAHKNGRLESTARSYAFLWHLISPQMCLCKITVVCKCVRRMHSVDSMISLQIMAWLERVGSTL